MIIKVCGMRDADNICNVEQLDVDWMGFIFYTGSSRYVKEAPSYLPEKSKRVGVFVDEQPDSVRERIRQFGLHGVQLHGTESPEYCKSLRADGLSVIKAFSIDGGDFFPSGAFFPSKEVRQYEGCCDYFLFDTKTVLYGGSGRKYDWDILHDYRGETPFLLSGGISPDDAEAIKDFAHPKWIGIDLNSRFELSPGIKDVSLLQEFIKKIIGSL